MNTPESVKVSEKIGRLGSHDKTRRKGLDRFRLPNWVDHFCGVVGMKPCCSDCMYNFYVEKPLLGLGKVARGTRNYAIRPSDEVPQYLGGVVRKAVRVAQLSQIYWTPIACSQNGLSEEGEKPDRLGCQIGLITSEV